MRVRTSERTDGRRPRRWATTLAAAAGWAMAVPYLGDALGVRLDVPAGVEIVDHVVPGAVVLAVVVALVALSRVGRAVEPGDQAWSVGAGATFLAGFWIASTHASLVQEAIDGITPWDAAVLHLSAGLPVLVAGTAMLLVPLLGSGGGR